MKSRPAAPGPHRMYAIPSRSYLASKSFFGQWEPESESVISPSYPMFGGEQVWSNPQSRHGEVKDGERHTLKDTMPCRKGVLGRAVSERLDADLTPVPGGVTPCRRSS
jgi:hypothetical protein